MKHAIYLLVGASLLSSCHVYDNYQKKTDLPNAALYRDTVSDGVLAVADTVNFGNMPWREVFTDAHLQALIEKALIRNSDMRTIEQSIKQAEAGLMTSRLAYFPSVSFSPQGTISSWDKGKAVKTYSVPITASWQLDANGSLRNAKKQAIAQYLQVKASKQAARTSLIASVANMYYTLEMLDAQLELTKKTLVIWQKNYEAMEYMQQAGSTTAAAVAQAKANYYQVESTVPTLEKSIRDTENSLCLLLGEAPHAIPRGVAFTDDFPARLSAGVPLQQLSNRPDVKSAELQLVNAFYGVNAAYSNFYPSITLTGSAGWTNSSGVGVVNPGKLLASAVASLVQPLFAKGQLKAGLAVAKAQQETAQINFEQTLLQAGQEVSNYLTAYQTAIKEAESRSKQLTHLQEAVEKTEYLFKYTSSTTYLETLTAQSSLLSAQLTAISDDFEKIQAAINLYAALGGGREGNSEKDTRLYQSIVKDHENK